MHTASARDVAGLGLGVYRRLGAACLGTAVETSGSVGNALSSSE